MDILVWLNGLVLAVIGIGALLRLRCMIVSCAPDE